MLKESSSLTQEEIWDNEYKKDKDKWKKESNYLPKVLKNKKVLELGVGNGKTLLSILKQNPSSVTAIDFSQQAIKISKSLIKNRKVSFKKENIKSLSFKKQSFDVIVCYYILNNLRKLERKKAVSEIHRTLKEKGTILFEDFQVNDFRQKQGKIIETNTIIKKNNLIQHFFTKNEIKILFKDFSKIKIEEKSFSPFKNKKHIKRRLISATILK